MSEDQLSTVQKLWLDRREEFAAYLWGESDVFLRGKKIDEPCFTDDPAGYTFRPKPKPPQIRPLTQKEMIARRYWWFRRKGSEAIFSLIGITTDSVCFRNCWIKIADMCTEWETSPTGTSDWQPCGVTE